MRRGIATFLALTALVVSGCTVSSSAGVTTTSESPVSTTTSAPPEPTVEIDGVTVTEEAITVGVLADLTGPYSTGVVDVLDAQLAFWADLNERGGIGGRQVEVLIEDTGYDTSTHLRAYHRLVDDVVMFSHSTGTAQTAAIADLLPGDHRVAIPLTWYSGWSTEPLGANLIEIGSNYCVEAANTLSYLSEQQADPLDLAVVTVPGDFGADSGVGALGTAEALGFDIVYDGSGHLVPGADLVEIAKSIAQSGADWTWLSADPSTAIQLVATATQYGYSGAWTGSSPTWNSRLLATQLGPMLGSSVVVPSLVAPLGADVDGMDAVYERLAQRLPGRFPSEALVVGYLEFEATRQILQSAHEQGDLTPQGVESVARALVGSGFWGLSPAADADRQIVEATGISRLSYDTFTSQHGLEATLAQHAVTPIEPVAGFDTYAANAGLDYRMLCPGVH